MTRMLRTIPFWTFFIIAFIQNQNEAHASHAQSADITYQCLGGNQYQITLSFYRDCAGTTAPNTAAINISSASCNQNFTTTLNQVPGTGQDVTPICASMTTQCSNGTYPGVQEYVYTGIIILPAACTDWVFSFNLCCRNATIGTINNPSGENIYVEAHLDNLNFPCNSSPTFSNPPIPFVCVGQNYCFNHGATDPDGDSLSYTLVAPATGPNTTVTYNPPYSASQPLASSPAVSFNALTGDICMTPTQIQVTVLAVLVEEWRNGVLVGSVVRDIQLRTVNCTNNNPYVDGINGTGQFALTACAGSNISFNINTFDTDAAQNVTLTWNNGIQGASFTTTGVPRPVGTFSWTPTQGNVSTAPYCFTVTVSDDNCPYNGSQTYSFCITVTGLTINLASTPSNCNASNGTATASVSGGTGPYAYAWSPNGGNNNPATGLPAGNYSVIVTDASGCMTSGNVTVAQGQANSNVTITPTNVSCFGGNNGSATANVNGGQQPYTYQWSNGGNTATISNLLPGTYTLLVTNGGGCTVTDTVIITQPATALSATASQTNALCNGSSNGTATVNAAGGTAPYTYIWNTAPAQTTATATGLAAGTYSVVVTDNNGCATSSISVTVSQPSAVSASIAQVNHASCYGSTNGSATAGATGGTGPYTFSWSSNPAQNNSTATNLAAGSYVVTITDNNGCTGTAPVTINQPGPMTIAFTSTATSCYGGNNGTATATASGGTAPYAYLWNTSPAQNTQTANNLYAGNYAVTVTDAHGCATTTSTSVAQPAALSASPGNISNVTCNGGNNGTATIQAAGGTGPYSYTWSTVPTQFTPTATNMSAGSYNVLVLDANGCATNAIVNISQPAPVATTASADVTICPNQPTLISASGAGGNGNYSYNWQPSLGNASSHIVSPAITTTYSVTAVDNFGCAGNMETVTVTVLNLAPQNLVVSAPATICQGSSAAVEAMVAGVPGNITYTWSPNLGSTGGPYMVSPAVSTTYTVTITDNCGNQVSATIPVTVNPLPDVYVLPQSGTGCDNVAFSFSDTLPANQDAIHYWSFGDGHTSFAASPTHAYTQSGTYIVTLSVTSAQGCTHEAHASFSITVYTSPSAAFSTDGSEVSILDPTVKFYDQSTNAIAWEWDFGDGNISIVQNPVHTYAAKGTYNVRLVTFSQGGCSDTTYQTVDVNPETTLFLPNAFTPNGDGRNDIFLAEGMEITQFAMSIFDRWGNMIFASDDMQRGWNGKANNGNDVAQQDVYVYKVRYKDYRGRERQLMGHVSLVK
jgi:gliding motility-associated-like protein